MERIYTSTKFLVQVIIFVVLIFGGTVSSYPQSVQRMADQSQAMSAETVNSGLCMAQNFIQAFNQLFQQFSTMLPKVFNMFTSMQLPQLPDLPSLSNLPNIPSIPTDISKFIETFETDATAFIQSLPSPTLNQLPGIIQTAPKDVELIDNDVIKTVDKIFMWNQQFQQKLCSFCWFISKETPLLEFQFINLLIALVINRTKCCCVLFWLK